MDLIRIGSFLAELRREKGLTQQALGDRLGVTNKTISRWETGCYLPDVEMLSLLSREFGVSINELVAGERLVAEDFKKAADETLSPRWTTAPYLKEKQASLEKVAAGAPLHHYSLFRRVGRLDGRFANAKCRSAALRHGGRYARHSVLCGSQ